MITCWSPNYSVFHTLRLQIYISNRPTPSKAKLKDLVVSRAKVDTRWIRGHSNYLRPHEFTTDTPLISSHYLPGGKFVVLVYECGSIELREVRISDAGKWDLVDVARCVYEQRDVRDYPASISDLLTETSYGYPAFAYTNEARDKLFVFLIDHISQTIEEKRVVEIGNTSYLEVWAILAMQNKIICCRREWEGWGILVVQLDGPNTTQKHLFLQSLAAVDYNSSSMRFFSVPGNDIVVAHQDGIHLYHIPELESVDDGSALFPVWSWSGESTEYKGCLYDTNSRFPVLHIQGWSNTHKLEFARGSGFPMVLRHTVTGEQLAYYKSNRRQGFLLKGRKGISCHRAVDPPGIMFNTWLVGKEDVTRVFHVCAHQFFTGGVLSIPQVLGMDFDEVTGRFILVLDFGKSLWLVDPLA